MAGRRAPFGKTRSVLAVPVVAGDQRGYGPGAGRGPGRVAEGAALGRNHPVHRLPSSIAAVPARQRRVDLRATDARVQTDATLRACDLAARAYRLGP